MALIALKPLVYGGRTVAEGEEFEVFKPQDERTLIAVKKAKLAEKLKKAARKDETSDAEEETVTVKSVKARGDNDDNDDAKAAATKDTVGKDAAPKNPKYQTRKLTAKE
jgi:hypothetical protein